jgi:hypothetical protein
VASVLHWERKGRQLSAEERVRACEGQEKENTPFPAQVHASPCTACTGGVHRCVFSRCVRMGTSVCAHPAQGCICTHVHSGLTHTHVCTCTWEQASAHMHIPDRGTHMHTACVCTHTCPSTPGAHTGTRICTPSRASTPQIQISGRFHFFA